MPEYKISSNLWVAEYIDPHVTYQHAILELLAHKRSQFQEIIVVDSMCYGRGLVLDGKWQTTVIDEFMYHEPIVHIPLLAHGNPRKVLVLGGGDGGSLREVLKWKTVERVVQVDIDGEVIALAKEHLKEIHQGSFDDPRAEVVIGDALEFIAGTDERWDAIISDLTDPLEEGPAFKLFTKEHFENCKKVLSDRGFIAFQAGSVSPYDHRTHARVVKTVQAVFPYATHYMSHTPTYGVPLGFALGGKAPLDSLQDAEAVDQTLATKTTGDFKYVDGKAVVGLMHPPKYLREAVATETEVYTLAHPPKAYGKGILGGKGE